MIELQGVFGEVFGRGFFFLLFLYGVCKAFYRSASGGFWSEKGEGKREYGEHGEEREWGMMDRGLDMI